MSTTCPATKHGTWRAYKHYGCTCPSENRERFVAHKQRVQRDNAARNAQKRAETRAAPVQPPARQITLRPAGPAERALRDRADLACTEVDPELFYLPGTGGAADAQLKLARSVCAACPLDARRLCLQAGLERADDFAVLAGTTPKQRREMRRHAEERSEVAA